MKSHKCSVCGVWCDPMYPMCEQCDRDFVAPMGFPEPKKMHLCSCCGQAYTSKEECEKCAEYDRQHKLWRAEQDIRKRMEELESCLFSYSQGCEEKDVYAVVMNLRVSLLGALAFFDEEM